MIIDPRLSSWLKHRDGKTRCELPAVRVITKALNLHVRAQPVIDTFGSTTFEAFVGFVDLCGFSERTKGRSPREVADYLTPFLNSVITRLTTLDYWPCLIDKTIGDEVMFVVPKVPFAEIGPVFTHPEPAFKELLAIQELLGQSYPFRVGLAWGPVELREVGGPSFQEWTVFGETVHLAARLREWSRADAPTAPFVGACGVLASHQGAEQDSRLYRELLDIEPAWRVEPIERPSLKGVGDSIAWRFQAGSRKVVSDVN